MFKPADLATVDCDDETVKALRTSRQEAKEQKE